MTTPDTDARLDRCVCGARAQFWNPFSPVWHAECSECAECTLPCESKGDAMAEWNKDMRAKRREAEEE